MKFSVLIAHYNNETYFKDCYQSLLKQTYPHWEAIILDDGSWPQSWEMVKKWVGEDPRFQLYSNPSNQGVGVTKAQLIEMAQGEIVGFVDPDDAILPDAIEKAVQQFQRYPAVGLVYSRMMTCDEHLQPLSAFKSAQQVPNDDLYFFNYPIQIAHFVTFRKEVYEKTNKMNSTLKIAEDQDLYLQLYEKSKVKFISETNYLYRTHSQGISQNENKEKSYQYFGEVIFNAMQRRGIQKIHGKKVPTKYTHYQEIFSLLDYQHQWPYRIRKKLKSIFQTY